jgi:tripartite-type tricarboxylate transporter receptor subunit TctC
VLAPTGTDAAIIARLNTTIRQAMQRPELMERLGAFGIEPLDEPPEAMAMVIRTDTARWAEVIRRAGIRAD